MGYNGMETSHTQVWVGDLPHPTDSAEDPSSSHEAVPLSPWMLKTEHHHLAWVHGTLPVGKENSEGGGCPSFSGCDLKIARSPTLLAKRWSPATLTF